MLSRLNENLEWREFIYKAIWMAKTEFHCQSPTTQDASCLNKCFFVLDQNSLNFKMDSIEIGPYLAIVSGSFLAASFQLYGYFRFKSLLSLIIIQKRFPYYVFAESIACMIYLFIGTPLLHPVWIQNDQMYRILHIIGRCLVILPADAIAYTEISRLWLIFYDLQYLKSMTNDKWKSKIDASSTDNDWYLHYRSKWGNPRIIALCSLGIYCCTGTISISTIFLNEVLPSYLVHALRLTAFVIPSIVMGWMWVHLPRNLNDSFFFEFEFRATLWIAITGFVLFVVAAVIQILLEIAFVDYLLEMVMAVLISIPNILSTVYIPQKIQRTQQWNTPLRVHRQQQRQRHRQRQQNEVMMVRLHSLHSERHEKTEKLSPHIAMTPTTSIASKLRSTFGDETKFENLVDWIYREFCSEIILCFIEMVQFKQRVKEYMTSKGVSSGDDVLEFELYPEIPKSSIVWRGHRHGTLSPSITGVKTEDVTGLRLKAHLLFEKYIKLRSEHEINISGPLRERYRSLDVSGYEELDAAELMGLFDDVINELLKYIRESFIRFDIHSG